MEQQTYTTIKITQHHPTSKVYTISLNRPLQSNALSLQFFTELPHALSSLDQNPDVSIILLSATGPHFCSGIDLHSLSSLTSALKSNHDSARTAEHLLRQIKMMQDGITSIEKCRKPVIACVHGACVGGGVDVVSACDVRYCTEDAFFEVKEVDLAITADLGSLQRLPRIVGFGNAMELALTARRVKGVEAKEIGLVSKVFGSREEMEEGVRAIAEGIAAKSPLAVIGTKRVMLQSRDLTLDQGLDHVATWNSAMLLSSDLQEVISAKMRKTKPSFSKL